MLSKKEKEKIDQNLDEIIKKKLLNDFKNKHHRLVTKVERINTSYEIDEDKSDRNNIYLKSVKSNARVWVKWQDGNAEGNDEIQLTINKPIQFSFNEDSQEFEVVDDNEINLSDISPL